MEFYSSLQDLQKSQQAYNDGSPKTYSLRALAPSLGSDKFAQNAVISVNISAKAQQLVELLESPEGGLTRDSIGNLTTSTRDILAEIEDKGLIEVLQSRLNVSA